MLNLLPVTSNNVMDSDYGSSLLTTKTEMDDLESEKEEGAILERDATKAAFLDAAGTKPTSNRQGVENCPAGTFSVGGANQCTVCDVGNYSTSGGVVGCIAMSTCGAGRYITTPSTSVTDTQCGDCVAGKATMGGDATSCTDCGTYSDEEGAAGCSTCTDCAIGQYISQDCTSEVGKFSSSGGAFGCTAESTCGARLYIMTPSTSTTNTECEDCHW
ncbi:hypothetical protein TrLO_g3888 [Triparma laevis f. longispina]|uniref:Uncharacterized protein n=1 Tax=Triparma laevis f. longispina TaxID=1714387 RepID=A0A9W7AIH1_9STRA|nr:hypothetical protein TrLO_g3888 [Triparma laevis f. longispina]